jgi:hypothetical protein
MESSQSGALAGGARGLYDKAVRPESLEAFMLTDNRAGQARLTLVYVLVIAVLAALLRLVPRWFDLGPGVWNLMPVGALALFAGSRLRTRWAWLVPLAVMFVSDLLLIYPLARLDPPQSAFSLIETPVVYGSFALYVALGRLVRQNELSPPVIGGAALLASVQFFVLTNCASWVVLSRSAQPYYTPDLQGLITCLVAAVPFHKNMLIADLVYPALIFGGYEALKWSLGRNKAPAVVTR